MNYFRNHIITRSLCFLMAFHIFNISVDMPDAQPDYITEDLSINDMESVVEIIVEQIIGIEDAFAEHNEPDHDDTGLGVKKEFSFYPFSNFKFLIQVPVNFAKAKIAYTPTFTSDYVSDITPPPPKA